MFEYRTGDILSADVEALVNTVNCVGIMGRGIALQFKNRFPENFKAYKRECDLEKLEPGKMFVFETGTLGNPKYVINFPTKRHWKGNSRIEDIEKGLVALKNEIVSRNIQSIAIPPLGSGLGGLNWNDVRPLIENELKSLSGVRVVIFEPLAAPEIPAQNSKKEAAKMTPGRAALVVLMHRYLGGLLDPFVTLLEVHKLMYLMQESGQPLKLKYKKAFYGPYAENLRHVLTAIEGHYVSGYDSQGDAPEKQLELIPGAFNDADRFLADDAETRARFEKVAKLVEGFETPFGLELLSTIHWVANHEGASTLQEVIKKTYDWNAHKRAFTERQITIAYEALKSQQWVK